ncbi:RNA polymerase sigma-70 factor [Parapedobacter sp. SGR-10]|uniref:RNA polymerase sigma factor n=1 Tax=Parapedobacter sp. SGR-10 TaxID=2710879 RepID=UPI0013D69003|nr:RNA polymerase sigma-70 factor [Parapedobacter sp. SGR-10]NGF55937.1 RNA polymerase sigma-70 factor [Parapedobacter sp. SGR-10]
MDNYKTYSDVELLALCKAGDETGFSEIYDRYWAVLYRHAYKLLKEKPTAQDVVQEVFVTLWDKIPNLELQSSLSSYLYTTVRNKILNVIQKEKIHERYITSFGHFIERSETVTDHRIREQMLRERIEREVAHLPTKMRHVFELSRTQHLSYKEIAQELNLSDKTVKKQVSNAIKILRLKLSGFISLAIWLILC